MFFFLGIWVSDRATSNDACDHQRIPRRRHKDGNHWGDDVYAATPSERRSERCLLRGMLLPSIALVGACLQVIRNEDWRGLAEGKRVVDLTECVTLMANHLGQFGWCLPAGPLVAM